MQLKFDEKYITNSCYSVAMVVANGVVGDSRVIKTASTLSKFGFRVHLFGLSKTNRDESLSGYPFSVELIKNPVYQMKADGVWKDRNGRQNVARFVERLVAGMEAKISNGDFQILHTHDMYGLPIGAKLREKTLHNALWVHDLHEHVEGCTNIGENIRATMLEYEKAYIRKPDVLTTVSPILSKKIAWQYDVDAPFLVLNAPRLSDHDPWYPLPIRKKLGLADDTPLFVYNGNVKPIRGVHFAIEALSLLPETHLALITDSRGPYMDDLVNRAIALSVRDRLHVHPYVPAYEVTSFLRDVNAGINPVTLYPNSDLALPNKIFEYIHSGTPIVSTATNALTEFLQTQKCGITFPEGDVEKLAASVRQVMNRYPQGLPNVEQGSTLAAKYSWETQEEVICEIYDRLLNSSEPQVAGKHRDAGRIIHLPGSSANQPFALAEALQRNGVNAVSALMTGNSFKYKSHLDIVMQKHYPSSIRSYFTDQELDKYDTYHFHARPLLYNADFCFPTGLDMLLLKAMGNAVYFHFRGSEIRLGSLFKQLTPHNYVDEQKAFAAGMPFPFNEKLQIHFRDFICGVCDDCFVTDPELQSYVPNAPIVPRAIDCNTLETSDSVSDQSQPLVVHAPSRRGVKGTDYVMHAVDQIKKEGYEFRFKLVENMTHSDAMSVYQQADIIIDQLRIGWYGVLAVEGMALGKAVVSYIRHDLRHYLPYPAPLAIANPDNVVDVMRFLLENPKERQRIGKAGADFVKDYHSSDKIASMLVKLYERSLKPIDPVKVSYFLQHQLSSFGRSDNKRINFLGNYIQSLKKNRGLLRHYSQLFRYSLKNNGYRCTVKKAARVLLRSSQGWRS